MTQSPIFRTLVLIILFGWLLLEIIVVYGIYYPIGTFLTLRPLNNIWSKLHTNIDDPIVGYLDEDEIYTDNTPMDTLIRRYDLITNW